MIYDPTGMSFLRAISWCEEKTVASSDGSRFRSPPLPPGILGVMFHTGDRVLVCTSYVEQVAHIEAGSALAARCLPVFSA